jgi:hypothetical protein
MCFAVVFSGTTVSAAASALPPGFLIGDQNGIYVERNGEYFINAVNLRPGEVIIKTLTIRNTERGAPFKLSMTAQPLQSTGPIDLLDKVHLNLSLDGQQLYDGRIRGDEGTDMIRNALQLGQYACGDSRTLVITLTVDEDMKISYERSTADIRWHFYAIKDETADPPKTGEAVRDYLLLFSAALAVGTIILIAARKKQRKDEQIH